MTSLLLFMQKTRIQLPIEEITVILSTIYIAELLGGAYVCLTSFPTAKFNLKSNILLQL